MTGLADLGSLPALSYLHERTMMEFYDDTIEMELEDQPVEEVVDGEWHEKAVGKTRLVMHMKGSRLYNSADCLNGIDIESFLPSDTYVPISHKEIVDEVEYALETLTPRHGVHVTDRSFVLGTGKLRDNSKSALGAKFFGLWGLSMTDGDGDEEIRAVIGAQNALDGTGAAIVAAGSQMFVCDNLAFSGALMKSRKHTGNIVKDITDSIWSIVRSVPEHFFSDVKLKSTLQGIPISGDQGYRILSDAAAYGCFANMEQYKAAAKEFRFPSYGVFARDESMWRVFNACTYGVGRKSGPLAMISGTNTVDSFFREMVG